MSRCGKAVWLLAIFATGCPDDPSVRDECDRQPDFFLTIRAEEGALPADLSLDIRYGGGEETLEWSRNLKGQIVFCDAIAPELGAGGSAGGHGGSASRGYGSLECELWTDGPATVTATAKGFEPIERDLRVDAEECTTEFEIELASKTPPI
jgi:hypothetical protein